MSDFSGKVALITGAAGNLGKATTHAFRDRGAKLILVDHAADRLQEQYSAMATDSEVYLSESTDLRDPEQIAKIIEETIQTFKKIDILVNITGGYRGGKRFHETKSETLDYLFDLNVKTLFNASRVVIPHMLAEESGSIINVGARAGLIGSSKMGAYSAAKSAVSYRKYGCRIERQGNSGK